MVFYILSVGRFSFANARSGGLRIDDLMMVVEEREELYVVVWMGDARSGKREESAVQTRCLVCGKDRRVQEGQW